MKRALPLLRIGWTAALLFAANVAPARADLNSVTASQSPPALIVSCPANVTFVGNVQGNGGEKFGWIPDFTLNGRPTSGTSLKPAVVDATGHVTLTYTMTIYASSSPGDWFEFNTQTADSLVNFNSARTPIDVQCLPATVPAAPSVAAPKNFHLITDMHDCGAHTNALGAFACGATLDSGGIAFAFDYPGKADAFKLYEVPPGPGEVAKSPSTSGTLLVVPKDHLTLPGCFAAAALSGAYQSPVTQQICVAANYHGPSFANAPAPIFHDFSPVQTRTWVRIGAGSSGFIGDIVGSSGGGSCDQPCTKPLDWGLLPSGPYSPSQPGNIPGVGYSYGFQRVPLGDSHFDMYSRLALLFDLSPLTGKKVIGASLNARIVRSWVNFAQTSTSCVNDIGAARSAWWQSPSDPLESVVFGAPFNLPTTSANGAMSWDVSALASLWVSQPTQNQGLVLRNTEENLNAFAAMSCFSQLDNMSLRVQTST